LHELGTVQVFSLLRQTIQYMVGAPTKGQTGQRHIAIMPWWV